MAMPPLSDRIYTPLKYVAQIVLPASATLYLALAMVWGFPNAEQIVGTITAVNTFMGVVLGLSTRSFNKDETKYDGVLKVEESDNKKIFSLVAHGNPENLDKKDEAIFKVIK